MNKRKNQMTAEKQGILRCALIEKLDTVLRADEPDMDVVDLCNELLDALEHGSSQPDTKRMQREIAKLEKEIDYIPRVEMTDLSKPLHVRRIVVSVMAVCLCLLILPISVMLLRGGSHGMAAESTGVTETASVTAAATPAVKRYYSPFAPTFGVVEVTENAEAAPLYMLADQDCDNGTDFTLCYGLWYDNAVDLLFYSHTPYEELDPGTLFGDKNASLKPIFKAEWDNNAFTDEGMTYSVHYQDVTWEQAMAGLPFGETTILFTRMAAEYSTYSVESGGLRLELIPLTEDLTTFTIKLSFPDNREEVSLHSGSAHYYDSSKEDPAVLELVDADGNIYALHSMVASDTFSLIEKPKAEIVGFRADCLSFSGDFGLLGKATTVELPLPADGEKMDVGIDFIFPDGVTKGRVRSVGYNAFFGGREHFISEEYFSAGYYTVLTDIIEQDGIEYYARWSFTEDYYAYRDTQLVLGENDPKCVISTYGLENGYQRIEHYIPDGHDTVTIVADRYDAVVNGCWDIDFTEAEETTLETEEALPETE